jgi:hypothetical protein
MASVWSEERRLSLWLRIELLASEGWARIGRIPPGDVEQIKAGAVAPSPARVTELERTTNHDVAAFVQAVAEPLGEAGRWIHFGLTSSDVVDTALGLQLREAIDLILERVEALLGVVRRRAFEHEFANFAVGLLGLYGQLARGSRWARLRGEFEKLYLTSASQHAGGTTEIQKNIIALRGLGLPRR